MTMKLVSTVTVGSSGAASIQFTNIPQTGTDLLVIYSLRVDGSGSNGENISLGINGSYSGFTGREIEGYGSGVGSNTRNSTWGGYANGNATANTFNNGQIYFPNYTSSIAKSHSIDVVTENDATQAYQYIAARSWSGTSAITSLSLEIGWFAPNSTASLYTITKGSGGATVA